MKKGLIASVLVLAASAVALGAYYRLGRDVAAPEMTTVPVSRGDIAEVVGATGTIEAMTTVQVGTQVSGTIQALSADFNSIVRQGQIVARLDPSLFETQTAQGRANLVRAQADAERQQVALEDAQHQLKRSRELSARGMIAAMELESSEATANSAAAQVQSSQAQVVQAQAALNQSAVNLQHTIIEAPIDGIVIARNVDVGQTVAASMQAPTLFVIAADLTQMRVVADIDESDVGRIRPGQVARFRVDAYADEQFAGTVTQVRLQPKVVQNVVTYSTVIDVPNPHLRLKPGMTATVAIEIARRADAIRIPVVALRFRPSADLFAALNQAQPADATRGAQQRASSRSGSAGVAGTSGTASMVPTDATTGRAAAAGQARGPALPASRDDATSIDQRRAQADATRAALPSSASGAPAQTVDALFGPLPITATTGRVWRFVGGRLEPVQVRLGISDGTYTEALAGDVEPGTALVSAAAASAPASGSSTAVRSPLITPSRGPAGGARPTGG